jgi:hypothetical protein
MDGLRGGAVSCRIEISREYVAQLPSHLEKLTLQVT